MNELRSKNGVRRFKLVLPVRGHHVRMFEAACKGRGTTEGQAMAGMIEDFCGIVPNCDLPRMRIGLDMSEADHE